jgi:hypothetical protein
MKLTNNLKTSANKAKIFNSFEVNLLVMLPLKQIRRTIAVVSLYFYKNYYARESGGAHQPNCRQ